MEKYFRSIFGSSENFKICGINSWNKLVKTSDEFVKRDELDLPVTKQDFLEAISKCNKSVSKEDLEKYEKWMEEFGSS